VAERVDSPSDPRDLRLHVVTGKGGTGKTTVASAIALMLARDGGRVLLVEVEGRQGLAQVFGTDPLDYQERVLAVTEEGGEVVGLSVEPEEALLDYLEKFYNLRRAGGALKRLGAVDFATTIAPGLRDVLLTGKVSEAVRRTTGGRAYYTHVVLDAPPTGRIGRFLNVTSEVAGIARVGPIRAQAELVIGVLRSDRTAVHLVSTLEDMPVQETLDAAEELRGLQLQLGHVVVSMTNEHHLDDDGAALLGSESARDDIITLLRQAGLPRSLPLDAITDGLIDEGHDHLDRRAIEIEQWDRLEQIGLPLVTAPLQAEGIDLPALHSLAEVMDEQLDSLHGARVRGNG
jgi:anion-transporting  ArsA/GET3 family ATPase